MWGMYPVSSGVFLAGKWNNRYLPSETMEVWESEIIKSYRYLPSEALEVWESEIIKLQISPKWDAGSMRKWNNKKL